MSNLQKNQTISAADISKKCSRASENKKVGLPTFFLSQVPLKKRYVKDMPNATLQLCEPLQWLCEEILAAELGHETNALV
jgi:hypothetical protein